MHPDVAASPPGVSRAAKLAAVHQQLEQAGLFTTSPWAYWGVAARCCCLLAAAVLCLILQWPVPGAVLLGLFWQQVSLSVTNCKHTCLWVQAQRVLLSQQTVLGWMPAGPPGCPLLSVLIVAAAPQVAFVGHDAGHNAVTHDRFKDGLIGLLVS